jgi:predicted DNA binding CopG/RHH family protein
MSNIDKSIANAALWESGKLGRDEQFVKRADVSEEDALDAALALQMISIRLQKQLIDDLKFIATAHGIGYQPLIRDVLSRFVVHEKKEIMRNTLDRLELERKLSHRKQNLARKQRKAA